MGLELAAITQQTKAVEALLAAQRETNRLQSQTNQLLWLIATKADPATFEFHEGSTQVPQGYERKKKRGLLGPKY
jgi:hypothetical protein